SARIRKAPEDRQVRPGPVAPPCVATSWSEALLGGPLLGLLAARGAQQLQPLLEELLELGDGAPLEQHVPVGARRLDGLELRGVAALEQGVLAAAAFPRGRDLGLDR